ncbi:MAG: Trm112 family protein [Nocardioides sp.]|uniref:Trm112 family protein n=1 Tax=Nocardioides sp. TaxID=35761 RepID=UPI0039E458BB
MTEEPAGRAVTLGLNPALLEIIVCPQCHGELRGAETPHGGELVCQGSCGLRYPVRDGIPVLLVDEALGADEPA